MRVLIVDGANVVGSRPNGWWRDRAGAARGLHQAIAAADLGYDAIVLVLEGDAKHGQPVGEEGVIHTVHASGSGDDAIVDQVRAPRGYENEVAALSADRVMLARAAAAGGSSVGASWLLTHTS